MAPKGGKGGGGGSKSGHSSSSSSSSSCAGNAFALWFEKGQIAIFVIGLVFFLVLAHLTSRASKKSKAANIPNKMLKGWTWGMALLFMIA